MLEYLLHWDYYLLELINGKLSHPFLDFWLIPWRNSLFWIPFYIFLIAFLIFNYKLKAYYVIIFLLLSVGSSDLLSSHVIKKNVKRLRPCRSELPIHVKTRVRCGYGYSFTSSHATNHSSMATFLFIVFGAVFRKWKWLLPFWAISIGIAQIYVGVHYPLDVLVGWILGTAVGYVWAKLFNNYVGLSLN